MAVILAVIFMPSMMVEVERSKLSFDDTVNTIQEKALANDWQVPKIYDIQASLMKSGYQDMTKLKILSMCQPDHAYGILSDDANKMVSSMMPCRIGVFENKDGEVFISRMNIGLMSKLFGGKIETVMGKVADEENRMLEGVLSH
jgi:uncharacterized protein (DUF302 family)